MEIFAALKIEPLEQIATEEDWEKMEGFLRLIGRKKASLHGDPSSNRLP